MVMGYHHLNRSAVTAIVVRVPLGGLLLAGSLAGTPLAESSSALAQEQNAPGSPGNDCAGDNGGITLPRGFCATVFADNIGHARHLVVSSKGVIFVNTWSGRYYGYDTPPAGGFLVALQDTDGDGRADVNIRFGDTYAQGSHGGTGIALYKDGLYAEVNDRIVRYGLPDEVTMPAGPPQVIVSELPLSGDHPMHPLVIDPKGRLYVDLGSATNSCQARNRVARSPGSSPCSELETRAGTWRYDADRTGQHFSPAERFATGIQTVKGSPSIRPAGCTSCSMAGTNSRRTGRTCTGRSRAPTSPPRSCCNWMRAPIMAGRNAISTATSGSWSSPLSTVATAAKPSAPVRRSVVRLRGFRRTGRPTI
jgi:glucose/arabinose dehydrogenase